MRNIPSVLESWFTLAAITCNNLSLFGIIGLPRSSGKESCWIAVGARDTNSIPDLQRSPRGRNGKPFQYSCLENPTDRGPGGLQSMGSLRVGHDWGTSLSLSCIGEGNGTPLQCYCLENPRNGGAWWAAVYGVAQSRTRLKWLSGSSRDLHDIQMI